MTLQLALKEFGGENCSKIDDILIITLGSAIRIWGKRCENAKIDSANETFEYIDSTTGLRHVMNLEAIESITVETEASKKNNHHLV